MRNSIDVNYFKAKLGSLLKDINYYEHSSDDLARQLVRYAKTANELATNNEIDSKSIKHLVLSVRKLKPKSGDLITVQVRKNIKNSELEILTKMLKDLYPKDKNILFIVSRIGDLKTNVVNKDILLKFLRDLPANPVFPNPERDI